MVPQHVSERQSSFADLEKNTSRTITTFGSIFLFINNTIGPGLALLPGLYQQSGWLPCAVCITILCLLSYYIGLMLTFSIRAIPHNSADSLKVEYVDLIRYYLDRPILRLLCQAMYLLFMVAFLTSSIIQTCQTLDLAIDRLFGHSVAFVYFPVSAQGFVSGHCADAISPFCD